MKIKITALVLILMSTSCFGQIVSYLTELKTSDTGIAVAELSLVHRSRSNYQDIRDLGSEIFMIPNLVNGRELKIELNRFFSREGTPFEMDGTAYVPVSLYYDNETSDPRDDIFVLSVPFPVGTELVREELRYYDGEDLNTSIFRKAPRGETSYSKADLKLMKRE